MISSIFRTAFRINLRFAVNADQRAFFDLQLAVDGIDKERQLAFAGGVLLGSAFHLAIIELDAHVRHAEIPPLKLLLDYPAAAAALSMSRGALRDLVYKGRGPVVTKIGSRTFFSIKDLERFVERHREGPLD